jgi:TPR repeat protein
MNEDTKKTATDSRPREPLWAKLLLASMLIWMVLGTEVNLNPPLESFADPNVDVDVGIAKYKKGDTAAFIPLLLLGVAENDPYAHNVIATYYENGTPPFHVDHCSAFDHYFIAAKLGDTDAQLKVAEMLTFGIGGYYKDIGLAYLFAQYAKMHGNKQADAMIYAYLMDLSEADRSFLEKSYPDWSPQSLGNIYPTYRLPVIPVLWRVMKLVVPMRFCNDPTILDHLRRALD